MKFVFMLRDELGDEKRAYGTEFLSKVHEFPNYDEDDEAMEEAFYTWKSVMEEKGNKEWQSHFGEECRIFLEREFRDMYSSKFYDYY